MSTRPLLAFGCALLILAAPSFAQSIAYESFTGVTLGSGIAGSGTDSFGWSSPWSGAGTSDSHFQIVTPTPSLSFQITGGQLVQGSNEALLVTTNPEPLASTLFATKTFPTINTTFYVSFLMRLTNSGTGTDSIDFHLMNGSSTVDRLAIRPNNPAPPVGYVWLFQGATGGSGAGYGLAGDNSTTHLIVVEIRAAGGGEFYITPFIDPPATYPGFPGGSGVPGPFTGIGIAVSSTDTGGPTTTALFGAIRIGYTWNDVVPQLPANFVPTLTIKNAVNVQWQSQSGHTYQPQYSYDLNNWFNFGSSVTGDGTVKSVFDSTASQAQKFYRVQIH